MRLIHKIWADLKQGENFDVYLTIIVSLILAVLNIFGITPSSVINSLSLAILALLAISLLGNRYRLDRLMLNSQTDIDKILFKEFSASTQQEIVEQMKNATDLLLIGTDLYRSIQMHYHLLENRLVTGKIVRILIVNPTGTACTILAESRYRTTSSESYSSIIKDSIQTLVNLRNKTSGKLELRIIDHPIYRGGVFTDMGTSEGKIYIWNHGFRPKEVARPKLRLDFSDGYWFSFYCSEADALWNNSIEWQSE